MSTILETEIDGFTVTLERMRDDGDPARGEWTECYVAKGRAASSLAKAEDFGAIGDNDETPIREATLDRIRALAARHGY